MPNGKIGDHPITDILVHHRRVYSARADGLIRDIVGLGGRDLIADLLFSEYNPWDRPDVRRLEGVLAEIHARLVREARERGREHPA
jgi:hypothetical protein